MKKYLLLLLLIASTCFGADDAIIPKQHRFNAWMPSTDASLIGPENLQTLQNLLYTNDGLTIVPGYTKVNTNAVSTYTKIRNGYQLRVDRATPSYVLIQSEDATGNSVIYQNQASIPNQRDFESTVLHTDASGASLGRFSGGPAGIVYANNVETMGWWGDEGRVAGFVVVQDVIWTASTIALSATASPDTINDANVNFLDKGFRIGQTITISGSDTAANDGDYTITDIAANGQTIYLTDGDLTADDAAGNEMTIEAGSGVDYLNPIDYTEAVANALTTSGNLAILGGGDDDNTLLLLHMNGTDGSASFIDDSSTAHTMTAVGNAQIDTAVQKFGTGSVLLDGTTDSVYAADHANWAYGTGEVTIEGWANFVSTSGVQALYSQDDTGSFDSANVYFYNNAIYVLVSDASAKIIDETAAWTPTLGTQYHWSLIRGWGGVADDWAFTVNGTAIHTFTNAGTWPNHNDEMYIGGCSAALGLDISPNRHLVQYVSGAATQATTKKYGDGGILLDGTNDNASVKDTSPASDAWDISTDWTIEAWVNPDVAGNADGYFEQYEDVNNYWAFYKDASNVLWFRVKSASAFIVSLSGGTFSDTASFHHIMVCKVDNDYGIYLDGVQVASTNDSDTDTFTGQLHIGQESEHSYFFDGTIDDARVYNGNPYSCNPASGSDDVSSSLPSAALTPDANTKVLLNGDTNSFNGHLDEVRISDKARRTSTFSVPVRAYQETQRRFYLFSTRPLQGFKAYISNANTEASTTLSGKVWTGKSFATITLSDGTSSGGITMAQTGSVTFSSTVSTAKPWHFEGLYLYAYMFEMSGGGADISQVTVDAPFQDLVDVWDGIERVPVEVQMYDASAANYDDWTLAVVEESSNLYPIGAELVDGADLMTSSDYLVIGLEERAAAIRVTMIGNRANTAAAKPTVYYWSGTDWVTVGTVVDTTATRKTDHVALSQTGLWSWFPPNAEDEAQQTLFGRTAYYYKVQFDANLAGSGDAPEVVIDLVTGIPAQYVIPPVAFPAEYKNQVFLFGHNQSDEGNRADFCAPGSVDVWNGELSSMGGLQSLYFGGPEPVVAAQQIYNRYGSNLIVGLLALKKTKAYMLTGDSPEDYKIYPVSQTLGCAAPLTVVSADAAYSVAENISRHVVIWLSSAGPVMFDGATLAAIKGVENYFDPNKSEYINTSVIDRSRACYDARSNTYHLLIPSGSSTECNTWLAYDLSRKKWYEIVPSTYPQAIWNVADTDGIGYLYGGIDTGYMMRLNNGTTWDGSGITVTAETGDFLPMDIWHTTLMRKVKVFATRTTEDVDMSVYHYHDTADDDSTVDMTFPLDSGSNRITWTAGSLGANSDESGLFHRYKFTATFSNTSDWSILGYAYQYMDQGMRD